MDGAVAEVVHRVVVAAVVLHRLRVVAEEVGRLLDLAERLEPVLADLDRHQAGVAHLALADQLGRLADERQTVAPRGRGPRRLGAAGGVDRLLDVAARALREVAEDQVAVDRRGDGRLGLGLALEAVDEVPVVPAELALRLLEAGLEGRVELLVVVAERRVGDLEPRSGFGGHSAGEPRVGKRS